MRAERLFIIRFMSRCAEVKNNFRTFAIYLIGFLLGE